MRGDASNIRTAQTIPYFASALKVRYNVPMREALTRLGLRQSRASARSPRAVMLASCLGLVFGIGCGEQGQRIVRLATFELPAEQEEGPIYASMMLTYYSENTTAPQGTPTPHNYPVRFRTAAPPALLPADEMAALEALVRIQAIDQSEPRPLPAITQMWLLTDWWDHLSLRSRLAFLSEYPE